MAEQKQYTKREIETNKDHDKVLIILHDKVYNVFPFLNEHPGGEEILLEHKGQESSEDFDDVGHSSDAMELMKKYQVGVLVDKEKKNQPPKKGWVAQYSNKEKGTDQTGSMRIYLLVGAFVLMAGLLYCKC